MFVCNKKLNILVFFFSFVIFSVFYYVKNVNGLYSSSSPVKLLNASDFKKKVVNSEDLWMVEFFANWCGHCQKFAPEYEKAAKVLKGIVKFAAVEDQTVMGDYGIKGFPTIKLFNGSGGKAVDYSGNRNSESVVDFVLAQIKLLTKGRLSGGSSDRSSSKKSSSSSSSGSSNVIVLTDNNFEKTVMQDENFVWFVEFYAPWCGHCKSLAPEWEALATSLKGKVKIAKVDATKEQSLAGKFSIQGYPTLKLFPIGKKSYSSAVSYDGPRTAKELSEFALKFHSVTLKAEQLISDAQFHKECKTGVCIITLLPLLYDVKAEGRKKQIEVLNEVVKANANMPVKFLWTQGGDNPEIETKLNLAFGYPAVIAVNLEKMKYGVHTGSYTKDALDYFLKRLMSGIPLDDIPKDLPKLKTVTKWDGKDIEEEKDEL